MVLILLFSPCRRHTVYLYSSDTPIEASSVQDEFLQELVGKASVSTNPYIVGIYNDSNAVPVSIPLTNLMPSTYILFVKVDAEWMVSGVCMHVCVYVCVQSLYVQCAYMNMYTVSTYVIWYPLLYTHPELCFKSIQ